MDMERGKDQRVRVAHIHKILDGPRGARCNAQACTRDIADKWLQRSMPIEDLTMVHVSLLGDIY
jgi:hypothetical protein